MGQPGFFDLQRRYEGLDAKSDPLVAILAAVPFELFRGKLKTALVKGGLRRSADDRKSAAGRKPWDEVLIFKALVLQALYNLSDDAMEYQLRDRLSFMRFVGLGLEDAVPDAKTLWLYREALAKAGAVEGLFNLFDGNLKAKGYLAMGGQIIDATIVPAPRQRNSRDDNALIKAGETPADWEAHPAKNRQKDKDARWTKKHGKSHFGYKNHIGIDRRHKLVRRYVVSTASVHDSQKLEDVLDPDNTASGVWADSPIAAKRPRRSSRHAACPATSIGAAAGASHSRRVRRPPTRPAQKCGRGSSISSDASTTPWAASSYAPSASSAQA